MISRSPVSGPFALALTARFGWGLDWLGVLPATGSTTLPGERLLRKHGQPHGGAHGNKQAEGLQPSRKQQVSPAHDVSDRLSLPLCCQELLGKALDSVVEEAGRVTSEHSGTVPFPAHVSETQPEMELLDN